MSFRLKNVVISSLRMTDCAFKVWDNIKHLPGVNWDVHQGRLHRLCGLLYHEHFRGMDT